MATPHSSLSTTLLCAAVAVGLLPLAGCWDTVPYTGTVESTAPATASRRTDDSSSAEDAVQSEEAFVDGDSFLDEDIFADTSSMFGDAPSLATDDTIVEKVPTPSPTQPAQEKQNTRQHVWKLGSHLSMAAIHILPLVSTAEEPTPLEESNRAATELQLVLPELVDDPFAEVTELSAQEVLETLLPMGRQMGQQVFAQYDREHVALFEVGFKSSILLVLYSPDSPMNDAMVSTIESGAAKAKLPPRLWQPLVDAINEQQPREAVEQKVFELHEAVFDFLAD